MMMMKTMKRDWSTLDDDLLRDIADRVAADAVEGYIRFRAVCTSWRSATVDPGHHRKMPPQLPWLMLTFDEAAFDRTRSFYRHSDGKTITLNLPEVLNYRILGSSEGWLVLVHESGALRLFNPLTKAQISLPALTTLPSVSYCSEAAEQEFTLEHGSFYSCNDVRDLLVNKVITVTQEEDHNGSGGGGPVVLVAMLFFFKLAFARVGDDRWTVVDKRHDYGDILFYRGKLYAVNRFRLLIAVDISGGPSNISFTALTSAIDNRRGLLWYLAPTEDDQGLLLVGRCYGDWRGSALMATKSFEVFRADNLDGHMNVTRVKSLGDCALFLGTNRAMSFNVRDVDRRGWKKDCIYFTQSVSDSNVVMSPGQGFIEMEHAGDDLGVFNLNDASIEPLPRCPNGSSVVWPQPIWFSPNLRHQTSSSSI